MQQLLSESLHRLQSNSIEIFFKANKWGIAAEDTSIQVLVMYQMLSINKL